jgi:hypothetical protein
LQIRKATPASDVKVFDGEGNLLRVEKFRPRRRSR